MSTSSHEARHQVFSSEEEPMLNRLHKREKYKRLQNEVTLQIYYAALKRVIEEEDKAKTYKVRFRIQKHLNYGENINICGNHEIIGNWEPNRSHQLQWSNSDIWATELLIPGDIIELKFKFIVQYPGARYAWQNGDDITICRQMLNKCSLYDYSYLEGTIGN